MGQGIQGSSKATGATGQSLKINKIRGLTADYTIEAQVGLAPFKDLYNQKSLLSL